MAASVSEAAEPVSQPLTRRCEWPVVGGAPAVNSTHAVPQLKPRRPHKKTQKAALPSSAKNAGRVPHKRASSSPPSGLPAGNCNYSGPKFCEPPSPSALPQPPIHWMTCSSRQAARFDVCLEVANQPKLLLEVKA